MPVQFDAIESKYFFLSAGFVYSETHIAPGSLIYAPCLRLSVVIPTKMPVVPRSRSLVLNSSKAASTAFGRI